MTDEKARAAETLRKTMAMLGKDETSQEDFDFHCSSLALAISQGLTAGPYVHQFAIIPGGWKLHPCSKRSNSEFSRVTCTRLTQNSINRPDSNLKAAFLRTPTSPWHAHRCQHRKEHGCFWSKPRTHHSAKEPYLNGSPQRLRLWQMRTPPRCYCCIGSLPPISESCFSHAALTTSLRNSWCQCVIICRVS